MYCDFLCLFLFGQEKRCWKKSELYFCHSYSSIMLICAGQFWLTDTLQLFKSYIFHLGSDAARTILFESCQLLTKNYLQNSYLFKILTQFCHVQSQVLFIQDLKEEGIFKDRFRANCTAPCWCTFVLDMVIHFCQFTFVDRMGWALNHVARFWAWI